MRVETSLFDGVVLELNQFEISEQMEPTKGSLGSFQWPEFNLGSTKINNVA